MTTLLLVIGAIIVVILMLRMGFQDDLPTDATTL
jgi:hypothetical protein